MHARPHTFPNPSFSITLLLCLSCQQGTDERSKVSPVEETAFGRSHASASLHASIHKVQGGEEKLSWQPLQVPSKCAHTCGPPSWWEPRSATSYPIASLPIIISTQLTHKYYSPYFIKSSKKPQKTSPCRFNSCQLFLLSTDVKISCPDGRRGTDQLRFISTYFYLHRPF